METFGEINKKKLIVRIASIILLIFVLNSLAMKFHWYFSIWYFDMPMHLLGGFWLGLVFILLFKPKSFSFNEIVQIILGFLFVALSWEVFEILIDKTITQNPFNILDTFSDICFGLTGSLISVIYFLKRIMIKKNIEI